MQFRQVWSQCEGVEIARHRLVEAAQSIEIVAEGVVRLVIVWLEGDRALVARHRLFPPAERGEHQAEIAMRLRSVGYQVERLPQRDLGLGKAFEAQQGGGAIDARSREAGDQLDRSHGAFQPRFEQAPVIQRAGEIAVRHAIIGIESNRPPIAVRRFD